MPTWSSKDFCTGPTCSVNDIFSPLVITQAMASFSPSLDAQYYMDIGATSDMTHSPGTLHNYSLLKHPHKNAIVQI